MSPPISKGHDLTLMVKLHYMVLIFASLPCSFRVQSCGSSLHQLLRPLLDEHCSNREVGMTDFLSYRMRGGGYVILITLRHVC